MDLTCFVKHRHVFKIQNNIIIMTFCYKALCACYQAAVFTNLYNGWKEHQSFVADLTESEEKKAIDKLKKEIIQAQKQKRCLLIIKFFTY